MPRNLALVADPNSGTIASLLPVLTKLGLTPVPARDGVEALRLIDREQPLVVIAEKELDVVSGDDLCVRLREEDATRSIPIVLMGAGDDRQGRLSALQSGADEFLSKPIDPEDARLRLATLLRQFEHFQGVNGDAPRPAPANMAQPFYKQLVATVNRVLEQARTGRCLDLGPVESSLARLVECSSELLGFALGKREATDLGAHHVNVAIIGLAVGRELELPLEDLRLYAMTGLVHDVGMVKVPHSFLYAPRRLTPREREQVEAHPRQTFELLKSAGRLDIAEIAHEEHERDDGRGYPRGLKGDQIHPLAKILGIADVYEACTHERTYDKTLIPYDALNELIEMREGLFPGRYIKALMTALTVFPIGSFVQLNTGEIGQVRATNRKNLMRPKIDILWGSRGQRLTSTKTVDLGGSPFLCITAALYEDQLPKGSP